MTKYFILENGSQSGPFSIEELKDKALTRETMVWRDGMSFWQKAGELGELSGIFAITPPPYYPLPPIPDSTSYGGVTRIVRIVAGLVIVMLVVKFILSAFNNTNNSLVNINVHPPTARIIESHANEDPSSRVFAFREGVYCTVLNEGGAGRLLVSAILLQGNEKYVRSQEVYLNANQSQELHFVFTEPHALGGNMKYEVTAKAL